MRENNRNSIEKCRKKLPQFTTMNVIDGQAGLMSYSSLIFYSLTIDNILNIIILLILAGITIGLVTGDNGILAQATRAKEETEKAQANEINTLISYENYINSVTSQVLDDDLPGNEDLKTFITQWNVDDGETIILPIYEKQETDEERGEKETYFNYNFILYGL